MWPKATGDLGAFQSPYNRVRHFKLQAQAISDSRFLSFNPLVIGSGTSSWEAQTWEAQTWGFNPLVIGSGTSSIIKDLRQQWYIKFQSPCNRVRHFKNMNRMFYGCEALFQSPCNRVRHFKWMPFHMILPRPFSFNPLVIGSGTSSGIFRQSNIGVIEFQSPCNRVRHFKMDLWRGNYKGRWVSIPL